MFSSLKIQLKLIINNYQSIRYIYIIIGCLFSAIGIHLFLTPNGLLADGATGLAMIAYFTLHLPLSLGLLIINIPLFYSFHKYLSSDFLKTSLFGFIIYTIILEFTSNILISLSPTNDLVLASVFGGVLNGIGCGFVFKAATSTGGTDIIGFYIKKKYGFDIGTTCFVINALIILLSLFTLGTTIALYTLISMYITGKLTDIVIDGINTKKSIFIVSKKYQEISKRIINEVERGTTILSAKGGYSGDNTKLIFSVVTSTQVVQIKQILHEVDPENSFLLVWDVSDIRSKNFTKNNNREVKRLERIKYYLRQRNIRGLKHRISKKK